MNKLFSVLVIVSGIALAPFPVKTQAQSECYIQPTGGQQIDLRHLCGNNSASNPVPDASGIYKIPIKRKLSGIPTVMVMFNGNQTFEMLFDTGASQVTITESMASAIGVRKEAEDIALTAGGPVPYGLGRVASVQVGNLMRKNVAVGISAHMDTGLLGQNFFGDYDVMIKETVIELHPRK